VAFAMLPLQKRYFIFWGYVFKDFFCPLGHFIVDGLPSVFYSQHKMVIKHEHRMGVSI
jgi:hypothetical protein